jgi:hypothetical protein
MVPLQGTTKRKKVKKTREKKEAGENSPGLSQTDY